MNISDITFGDIAVTASGRRIRVERVISFNHMITGWDQVTGNFVHALAWNVVRIEK